VHGFIPFELTPKLFSQEPAQHHGGSWRVSERAKWFASSENCGFEPITSMAFSGYRKQCCISTRGLPERTRMLDNGECKV